MRPSWMDALLQGAARVPLPAVPAIAVTSLPIAILLHVAELLESPGVFSLQADLVVGAVTPSLIIWVALALDRVAGEALRRLRPALDSDLAAETDIARDLVRTPNLLALPALLGGIVGGVSSVYESPGNWGVDLAHPGARLAAALLLSAATDAVLFGVLAHVLHQLRVVSRVHRESVRVDLFHLTPLYAFSTLTARTGIALISIVVALIVLLSLTIGRFLLNGETDIAVTVGIFGIAVACFVVPLQGLHDRISDEKDVRLAGLQATLASVIVEFQRRVGAGDVEGAGRLNDTIAAARAAVDAVARISTWPWRPETLRGFVSALALPVVVWLFTALLGRALALR